LSRFSSIFMNKVIGEIRKLFLLHGKENYFGEEISQFEHAAQALMMAIIEDEPLEMQAAAFLHDIGHLLASENTRGEFGNQDHEILASQWLKERGFSEKIRLIIQNHVAAKRYLCWSFPTYYKKLSRASRATLAMQGGEMSDAEAMVFENQPYFEESLQLRYWDDMAKTPNLELPDLDECLDILKKLPAIGLVN
jgi:2-amino-1-hydroxyethylphosphonate dioxygenase (glycine-forming)